MAQPPLEDELEGRQFTTVFVNSTTSGRLVYDYDTDSWVTDGSVVFIELGPYIKTWVLPDVCTSDLHPMQFELIGNPALWIRLWLPLPGKPTDAILEVEFDISTVPEGHAVAAALEGSERETMMRWVLPDFCTRNHTPMILEGTPVALQKILARSSVTLDIIVWPPMLPPAAVQPSTLGAGAVSYPASEPSPAPPETCYLTILLLLLPFLLLWGYWRVPTTRHAAAAPVRKAYTASEKPGENTGFTLSDVASVAKDADKKSAPESKIEPKTRSSCKYIEIPKTKVHSQSTPPQASTPASKQAPLPDGCQPLIKRPTVMLERRNDEEIEEYFARLLRCDLHSPLPKPKDEVEEKLQVVFKEAVKLGELELERRGLASQVGGRRPYELILLGKEAERQNKAAFVGRREGPT